MRAHDREVAGIRCTEVLDDLSAYIDGELAPGRVAAIRAHLAGCDWCERFGGDFAGAVAALRRRLAPPPLDVGVRDRLLARFEEEAGG